MPLVRRPDDLEYWPRRSLRCPCAFGWLAHSRNARLRLFSTDTLIFAPLPQSRVGTGGVNADAPLPKGHVIFPAAKSERIPRRSLFRVCNNRAFEASLPSPSPPNGRRLCV